MPPLAGTGNVSSGRLILEYAKLGCESVQLHTFFQLPLAEYPATAGSRTQRALHALALRSRDGLIAGMLDLEAEAGSQRRDGELRFLDCRARVPDADRASRALRADSAAARAVHHLRRHHAERRSLVVVLHDDEGHRGYGESPPFELPFYSEETLASARDMLERVLIPRVIGAERRSPRGGGRRSCGPACGATALPAPRWRPRRGISRRTGAERRARGAAGRTARRRARGRSSLRRRARHPGGSLARHAAPLDRRRARARLPPGQDQGRAGLGRGAGAGRARGDGGHRLCRSRSMRTAGTSGPSTSARSARSTRPGCSTSSSRCIRTSWSATPGWRSACTTHVCVDETLRDARAARQIAELGGPMVWNVKVHRMGGLSEVCRVVRIARECGAKLWAGHHAGVGPRLAGRARGGRVAGIRLPLGSRAQRPLVRPKRRRHQAHDVRTRAECGCPACRLQHCWTPAASPRRHSQF